ncbi:hypothetical protein LT493_14900 [Streptomyces tricolor]|nr:hypothetical protein [Streptomyces tricolor]
MARLHRLTGPGFGYPSGALGPLAPDWRTAFTAMLDAVLADARDYAAELPRPRRRGGPHAAVRVRRAGRGHRGAPGPLRPVAGATSSWTGPPAGRASAG